VELNETPSVTIGQESPWADGVSSLIQLLDDYLFARYPAEARHILDLDQLAAPTIVLLIARVDGVAVGCGAVRFMDVDVPYAEIKRMFVHPGYRGRGIAKSIISGLEEVARDRGLSLIRLETGIHQPEANGLYERAGYRLCGSFGEYVENGISVFFEKGLKPHPGPLLGKERES